MMEGKISFFQLFAVISIGILTSVPDNTQAANILCLFPSSATSHNNVFSALTRELALRGHHITVITPHPISSPPENYEQINVIKAIEPHFKAFSNVSVIGFPEIYFKIRNVSLTCCDETLKLPEVRKLIDPKKSGKNYDLIIISNFFTDCYFGFAHVYKAPVIMVSPAGVFPHTDSLMGNVALPSFAPIPFLPYTDRMTFLQRALNFLSLVGTKLFTEFLMYPEHEEIMKKHFGESVPPLSELHRRISLTLLNNHFTLNYPRPMTPSLVEVGGMHVKTPKPLPKDLKTFMDESKDGVIFFSMGSNVKSANFPDEIRDMILSVFSELKEKVLWKWETDDPMPGQPENVRLEKWLPQTDILAHPNMKLFITHGGLLSCQEAVYRGVPVIGIPMFGDQDLNMEKVTNLGVGLKVPYIELTKEKLLEAIKTILNDPSYKKNMKELSRRVIDQPQPPLERAVYWTEYVIRHKGAKHLASAALDLSWYQLYLLDVIAVLIVVPTVILSVILYCLFKCCRRLCGGKRTTEKVKPKSKKH